LYYNQPLNLFFAEQNLKAGAKDTLDLIKIFVMIAVLAAAM
jgi:hypothetical protein